MLLLILFVVIFLLALFVDYRAGLGLLALFVVLVLCGVIPVR